MRSIGTSVCSAVAGVVLAHMTVRLGPASVPSQNAFRVVMVISAAGAVIALAVAAFLPGRRAATSTSSPMATEAAQAH